MKFLLATIAALVAFSAGARAQQAVCPAYSMAAKLHPTTETAYTIQVQDQCARLIFQNTAPEVVTLPNPGAFFPFGFIVMTFSSGAGGITLTPTSPVKVNGASSLAKAQGTYAACYNDGANWWC